MITYLTQNSMERTLNETINFSQNLKVRVIFSPKDIFKCKHYLEYLDKNNYYYSLYNADLEENQDELDEWKISSLPTVQIVKGTKIIFQFAGGTVSIKAITQILKLKGKTL